MAYKRSKYLKRQAGQSVIIAIAVMFILAFIAALFTILLTRNLERTTRASQTLTADFYAQSGIQYADQMLTTSAQGADWRPALGNKLDPAICTLNGAAGSYTLGASTLTADEAAAYKNFVNAYYAAHGNTDFPTVSSNDPDKFWLLQGFTRYNTQGGRFLIRLSYGSAGAAAGSPFDSTIQNGKYIKIESIGRTGEIDANDPTTFRPQPIRLHAEQVAYKPIGLVDYSRFITNKYQRTDTAALGVPSKYDANASAVVTPGVYDFDDSANPGTYADVNYPLITTYGDPALHGGSLRSNTSLRLDGINYAYLDNTKGDDWEVAGNLTFDGYSGPGDAAAGKIPSTLYVTGTESDQTTAALNAQATPSNIATAFGGNYDSVGGLIRDGSESGDYNGFPRAIKRLNPPSLDTVDSASKKTRYAEIASIGTPVLTAATAPQGGPYMPVSATGNQPATVFIDNANDVQPESTNVISGAYTLRDDWLNRISSNWEGPFYNPPGATIVFGPIFLTVGTTQKVPFWGFTITRTDLPVGLPNGSNGTWQWTNPDGTPGILPAKNTDPITPKLTFVYAKMPVGFTQDVSNPVCFLNADTAPSTTTPQANNDIVIYAEGNVRVRGVVSDPRTTTATQVYPGTDHHVTIVTNQIAYIEGSILKGGPNYSAPNYASNSSIAILAERYCCLNTTQFLAGADVTTDLGETAVDSTNNSIIFTGNSLTEAFDLPPTALYGASGATNGQAINLYLSQFSEGSDLSLGLVTLEPTSTVYATASSPSIPPNTTVDGATIIGQPVRGSSSNPNRTDIGVGGVFGAGVGFASTTGFTHLDMTFARSSSSAQPYLLERAALLPSDIRIEAVLYAQNNSFFVIPGPWFNSDPTDTTDRYVANSYSRSRPPYGVNPDEQGVTDQLFPFYAQPVDMKVSVVGSVVENLPANLSDQTAWMMKWGWIPKWHGQPYIVGAATTVSLDTTPHTTPAAVPTGSPAHPPAIGLNIQYDQTAGSGTSNATGTVQYTRLDQYGRPLPYVPDLPVSPDLLYSGATADNSLVQ